MGKCMSNGCKSEVGKIERLLLKHARDAFVSRESLGDQWRNLNYTSCPDFDEACREYDRFADLLSETVPEIHFLPTGGPTGADSIYVRDTAVLTPGGAVLCNMGKEARTSEPHAVRAALEGLGVPILGSVEGSGRLEGGDLVVLDERTIVVGEGYRTNAEGIRQLREFTRDCIDEVFSVPLPHWHGPDDVFHLMSFLSPVDVDKLLVYPRPMPVTFRHWLLDRGYQLIEVPDGEFETMACNVLAISPGRCIALEGNSVTLDRLDKAGVEVRTYKGEEISRKGAGGPTCLTRPLLRV